MLAHEKQISEYEEAVKKLKESQGGRSIFSQEEIAQVEEKLHVLKKDFYANLSAWERVAISRHPDRPRGLHYIKAMCHPFEELFGDRLFRDDPAIVGGVAKIGAHRCMVIAQEKGSDTESRLHRNFGMPHPEGYRKALRLMRLAEKFLLPVVLLLDTPGAFPGLAAEERGQGAAIAENLAAMSQLATPIIVVIIGEGCSGGALGMGVGDRILMLEHAYYSVISPEACASILWRSTEKAFQAAEALKLNSEYLYEKGIVDQIIPEPLGGGHNRPEELIETVQKAVEESITVLTSLSLEKLLEDRYEKFRSIGSCARHSDPLTIASNR